LAESIFVHAGSAHPIPLAFIRNLTAFGVAKFKAMERLTKSILKFAENGGDSKDNQIFKLHS
jgi:hypothetical protein